MENGDGIVFIAIPFEDTIVQPGAQNGKRHDPQHTIDQIIIRKAKFLAPLAAVKNSQHQAAGNDDAIEMDAKTKDFQTSGQIHFQAKQRNGGITSRIHIFPPLGDK
jgi:hypothetical protein